MTCLLAFKSGGHAYLAGDRGAYDRDLNEFSMLSTSKIAAVHGYHMGVAGSLRLLQLVHHLPRPQPTTQTDPLARLVTALIPAIRDACKADENDLMGENAAILCIDRTRLFMIESDWGVVEPSLDYIATGSGGTFAQGAAAALLRADPTAIDNPEAFAHTVFEAARTHCFTMGPCADIVSFS